jgi:prolyl oligopeptidase
MRYLLIGILLLSSLFACKNVQHLNKANISEQVKTNETANTPAAMPSLNYPNAKREPISDNYHGTMVADPYRWLEDENSADTHNWIAAQNMLTQDYLSHIDTRPQFKKRLTELWNYTKYGVPYKKGAYYYFSKNDGLQNHDIIYRQKTWSDTPEIFLDPNQFSTDGTVSLANLSFSKNGNIACYATSEGGSDWQTFHVIRTEASRALPEKLQHIKFSDAAWLGNEGFFYSRYPAPQAGKDLSEQNVASKVYFHAINTKQTQDILVFEDNKNPQISYNAQVTQNGKYIILYATDGAASGNALYYMTSDQWQTQKFKPLIANFTHIYSVIDNIGEQLLVMTNLHADRFQVVLIDPKKPDEKNWKTLIPEQNEVLEAIYYTKKHLVTQYMKDVSSRLYLYDQNGKREGEITLPTLGIVSNIWASEQGDELYYQFESFLYPPTIFKYDFATAQSTIWHKPDIKFNFDDYETQQVFYKSKDGTSIPLFITKHKNTVLNGQNPTLLYGYGGFNIARKPEFKVENLPFYEKGGVYAVANLRGGSEYGEAWHKAGMFDKKQNVFDDYIAAAQYLIDQKYCSPQTLAATGRSNGGLLMGAVMNQRPDLFAVALPTVGVMDMLRYQKFTIGWAWVSEYGSSDNAEQFNYLYAYSPYHGIAADKPYPATLCLTAERDDRVVPAHSFKYIAQLQHLYKGKQPQLIRIEKQSGHGAGKTINARIDTYADIWAFVFKHLAITK